MLNLELSMRKRKIKPVDGDVASVSERTNFRMKFDRSGTENIQKQYIKKLIRVGARVAKGSRL